METTVRVHYVENILETAKQALRTSSRNLEIDLLKIDYSIFDEVK